MPISTFARRKDIPNPNALNGVMLLSGVLPNDSYIAGVPKNIFKGGNFVGNVGLGLDTLLSFTLPAKSLKSDLDLLHFWLGGAFGVNDDDKRIQISFGGNILLNTGTQDLDNVGWFLEGIIIRLSNTQFNFILNANLGQIVVTSAAVVSSPGAIVTARTGNIISLSGGTTFNGNDQILLLEAESATATDNNIIWNVGKIELTRF